MARADPRKVQRGRDRWVQSVNGSLLARSDLTGQLHNLSEPLRELLVLSGRHP